MFFKNLKKISSQSSKKSIIILSLLILISMIIETLSIGLIIPAIAFITQDDFFEKYQFLVNIFSNFSIISFETTSTSLSPKKINFIIFTLTIIVFIYFLKAIILSLINLFQIRFNKSLKLKISVKLFNIYLFQPYTFFLSRNTSVLLRNIDECNRVVNALQSLIILITEIFVLIGISTLLFFFTTFSSLFVMIFFLIAIIIFYYSTKGFLLKWGKERHQLIYFNIKQLQQGFQGIKDVKILGKQSFFVKEFYQNKKFYYSKLYKTEFIKALPKLWLEFLIISTLISLFLILLMKNQDLKSISFSLGVIAATALRILPSVNRIINSLQILKNDFPSIETINKELDLPIEKHENSLKKFNYKDNKIVLKDIDFTYPNETKTSLKAINLTINKNETVGIIGESGSGKSTLLDIILGLLPIKNKNIVIFGNDLKHSTESWQKEIGYVPQNIYLIDDTIEKNIALGLEVSKINQLNLTNSIQQSQLKNFIQKQENGLKTVIGERGSRISGGEKQRIGIARALYRNPSVLVFDEATSSLDLNNEAEITNTIRNLKGKKTIIIVSHRMSTVKNCDKIFRMENGKLTLEKKTFNEKN